MPTHGIHPGRAHGLLRCIVGLTRGGLTLGPTLGLTPGPTPGPAHGHTLGPTLGLIPGPTLGHPLGVRTPRATPHTLGPRIHGRSMCPPTPRAVIRMILTAADTTRHIIPPITHTTNPVTLRCS